MKRKITFIPTLILLFFLANDYAFAQLSGPKTIPGDYVSIASAISDLNTNGVGAGGVTFNVLAGYTEISSNLVIAIVSNQPTASNQVIFQKSGIGANPLITAAPGSSAALDGIIKISGADNITFDGINLLDPVSNTGDAMMEWGIALLRASSVDGSQFITIKNCTITLQKNNTSSVGIYVANRDLAGTTITASDPLGFNSNNKFYGNVISNVYKGITVLSASTSRDENNEVGVIGQTSNSISNFGGGNVSAEGIRCEGQINLKINNNIVNGGSGSTNSVYGIIATLLGSGATVANYEVSNNQVTIQGNSTSTLSHAIRCLGSGDTVKILNNIVENCVMSNTSASFAGISHGGTSNIVYMLNNIVRNNTHAGTGACDPLGSTSSVTSLFIHSNEVYNNIKSGTGVLTLVEGTGTTLSTVSIRLNKAYGNQVNGTSGTINCIQAGGTSGLTTVTCDSNQAYNNSIPNTSGTTASVIYGYLNSASPFVENVFDNLFYNLSIGGAGTSASSIVTGIRTNTASTTTKQVYSNTIYGLSGVSGTSTTGGVYGIWSSLGASIKIFRNKIYDLTNNGTTGTTAGIWITTGTSFEIYNNFISNLKAPNSNNANAVMGINSTGPSTNSTIKLYYNSIHLNSAGGSTFGSSGVSVVASATSTTGNLEMKNNIINNLSTPGSTSGFTVVFRRSLNNLSNYSLGSNYNVYSAGTPSANRLLFYDGTNSAQNMSQYLSIIPQEGFTILKSVEFDDPAVGNLHLIGLSNGDIQLRGDPIPGITTDIDGEMRNEVYPYRGADEASIPLPVELASFTASIDRRDVHLNWTTASEMNNSGFNVERKSEGSESWNDLGFVSGNGTTTETKNYSFTDRGLNSGKYNYRLKQVDYNGNFEYFNLSSEVNIGVPDKYDLSQNYPNPFNPTTKINFDLPFDSKVTLKIYDISGREIKTLINDVQTAGYYTLQFDASTLSSGAYFYRINAEGGNQNFILTKKMVVIK